MPNINIANKRIVENHQADLFLRMIKIPGRRKKMGSRRKGNPAPYHIPCVISFIHPIKKAISKSPPTNINNQAAIFVFIGSGAFSINLILLQKPKSRKHLIKNFITYFYIHITRIGH